MPWKIFTFQTIALVFLTYVAAQYFSFPHEEQLAVKLNKINEQMTQFEQQLQQVKKLALATQVSEQQVVDLPSPPAPEDGELKEQMALFNERLERLEKREEQLWQATADLIKRQNMLVKAQQQTKPEPVRGRDWISHLDTEKKEQVQATYREEMEEMQDAVAASSADAKAPSPETMFRLLQESRERLKLKLKEVLSEEEYQAFLQSFEAADMPLPPH